MSGLKFIYAALAFFPGICPLCAQIKIVSREQIEAVASPMLGADSASLQFDVRYIKAGKMAESDAPKTFSFGFENIGREPLRVTRLVTTCSCASATGPLQAVQPGQRAEINVRYNPEGHPGRFERRVFVYVNDAENPAAVLRLSVDVESGEGMSDLWPVQMGKIRLKSKEVRIPKSEASTQRVRFVNVSDLPLKVECERMFLPDCLGFETTVTEAGKEGEMLVTYRPVADGHVGNVRLMLKGLGLPPSQSTLIVIFE